MEWKLLLFIIVKDKQDEGFAFRSLHQSQARNPGNLWHYQFREVLAQAHRTSLDITDMPPDMSQ